MTDLHIWLTIAVIALITALLRFVPFAVWNGSRNLPRIIEKLGGVLPYAIMGMLVVYCLKDTDFKAVSAVVPTLIACLVVALSYIWKRNTLISIVCGTVCYMVLVQAVF